jgi:hypothetical protein
LPQVAPPAATGNAGPQFEAKVGAFYLLSLLSGSEARGLPGATIRTIESQQRGSGRPLDDGSSAVRTPMVPIRSSKFKPNAR